MATFVANTRFNVYNIVECGDVFTTPTRTSTKMVALDTVANPDVTYTLSGTGFTYNSDGLSAGTLTSVTAKLGTVQYFTSSNLSYNLKNNYYDGGVTVDYIRLTGLTAEVSQWLKGNDTINGSASADTLAGFVGSDKIYGNAGNDVLEGWSGNDYLKGGTGYDELYGMLGNDTLAGGSASDTLVGGGGNDVYLFNSSLAYGGVDRIKAFGTFSTDDDRIYLDGDIFTALGGAGVTQLTKLSSGMFRAGTKALDSNDHLIYNRDTGALIYDANGNAAGGTTQIALIGNSSVVQLTAADFYITV